MWFRYVAAALSAAMGAGLVAYADPPGHRGHDLPPGLAKQGKVPPGHAKKWHKYCHRYHACGERVYFVRDDWYEREYAPRYRERHYGHRDHDRHDYRHDDRGDYRDGYRDGRRDEHRRDMRQDWREDRRDDRRHERQEARRERHDDRHDDRGHGRGRGRDD